jgi:hypothetical protein
MAIVIRCPESRGHRRHLCGSGGQHATHRPGYFTLAMAKYRAMPSPRNVRGLPAYNVSLLLLARAVNAKIGFDGGRNGLPASN